jgi:hypothetical protein
MDLNHNEEDAPKDALNPQDGEDTSKQDTAPKEGEGDKDGLTIADPEAFLKALEGLTTAKSEAGTDVLALVNQAAGKQFADVDALAESLKNADKVAAASGQILKELEDARKELAALKGGTKETPAQTNQANAAIIDALVLKEISPLTSLVKAELESIAKVSNLAMADIWNANIGGIQERAKLEQAKLNAIESVNKNINKPSQGSVTKSSPTDLKALIVERQKRLARSGR